MSGGMRSITRMYNRCGVRTICEKGAVTRLSVDDGVCTPVRDPWRRRRGVLREPRAFTVCARQLDAAASHEIRGANIRAGK